MYAFSIENHAMYWCHVNADDSYASGIVHTPGLDLDAVTSKAKLCALDGPGGPWTILILAASLNLVALQATVAPAGTNQVTTASPWSELPGDIQPTDPGTKQPVPLTAVKVLFSMDESKPPIAIVQDHQGDRLWSLTVVNQVPDWTLIFTPPQSWPEVIVTPAARALPESEVGAPAYADKALDLYVRNFVAGGTDLDNTVNVLHQLATGDAAADSAHPVFTPAVPLQPGIGALAVPSGRGSGTGLIAMGLDGSLQSLTVQPVPANPATGAPEAQAWVGSPIHLPASESIQVSSYRVQLTVTDAAGMPVIGTAIQVTCAVQVPALCNGKAVALGGGPVTLQTGSRGQVTLAIPADGLACPALTVSANGQTCTVRPSAGINAYCTGSTPLNMLPPLAAGGHITKTSTLSADQFTAVQTAAQGAIAAPSIRPGLPAAHRPPAPRLQLRPLPGAALTAEQQRVGSLLGEFLHDVVQAVKSGAASVEHTAVTAATDTTYAVVTIAAEIAALAGQALTVVVHDLDDAAAAIHAVINEIGADLEAAIDWLKAAISGLFADTALLASQYDAWIYDACGFAQRQISAANTEVHNWFAGQRNAIDTALSNLKAAHGNTPMSGLVPPAPDQAPEPAPATGPARPGAGQAPAPNPSGAHANWLLDKIEQVFDGPSPMPTDTAIETAFTSLASKLTTAGGDFDAACTSAKNALTAAISDPKDVKTAALGLFLDALRELIDGALTLADAAVGVVLELLDAVLGAISAILDTTIGQLPIIGSLLQGTSLEDLTLGKLACLLYAFPAMLTYKVAHGGAAPPWLHPQPTAPAGRPASTSGPATARGPALARPTPAPPGAAVAETFALLAAATTLTWSSFDTVEAVCAAGGVSTPWWTGIADIVGAAVLGAFTFPATGGSAPYSSWPVSPNAGDQTAFFSYLAGLLQLPAAAATVYVERAYPGEKNEAVRATYAGTIATLTTASGVFSADFAIISAVDANDSQVSDYFLDILYALPAALSYCLLTDGLPPAIVAICCLINAAAALYQILQAASS